MTKTSQIISDKDQIKTQLGPRDRTEGDLVFRRYSETLKPKLLSHITIKQAIGDSFVLGHADNGVLGSDQLGENNLGTATWHRVVNVENRWREYVRSNIFKDTVNTTATWDTVNFRWTFAAGQDIYTLAISLNDGALLTAKVVLTTAQITNIDNLIFYLSADAEVSWVAVDHDTDFAFAAAAGLFDAGLFDTVQFDQAAQGTDLRLRVHCSNAGTAQIDIDDADDYSFPMMVEYTTA